MDSKIKILIATGIFPPDIGGPARYAEALCQELGLLGCEVKIITYCDDKFKNKDIYNGVEIINVYRKQNTVFKYLKYFWESLKLSKWADYVYILDLISAGLPSIVAARIRGRKIIFRTGGDFLWEKAFQSGWTNSPLKEYYKEKKNLYEKILLFFCRKLIKKIDLIIFSTKMQADIYLNYYNLSHSKIRFISNPIPKISAEIKDDLYKNSIVFAGRLIKLKNIERLINAFKNIDLDEKLLIFGEGPEKNRLEDQIKKLNLGEKIKMCGMVSHKKLLEIINSCKFVILPSVTEISPNLALECLSMAKPIILTKETGLDDIGQYFIKINPLSEHDIEEKIKYLLNNKNLEEYKERLRNVILKKRNWADIASEHYKIFRGLKK